MNLEIFNNDDLENIKRAKHILNEVIRELRAKITKKPKTNKIRFSNFMVGSGRHMIILMNPDQRKFDIDCQIIISDKIYKNRFSNKAENFMKTLKMT